MTINPFYQLLQANNRRDVFREHIRFIRDATLRDRWRVNSINRLRISIVFLMRITPTRSQRRYTIDAILSFPALSISQLKMIIAHRLIMHPDGYYYSRTRLTSIILGFRDAARSKVARVMENQWCEYLLARTRRGNFAGNESTVARVGQLSPGGAIRGERKAGCLPATDFRLLIKRSSVRPFVSGIQLRARNCAFSARARAPAREVQLFYRIYCTPVNT